VFGANIWSQFERRVGSYRVGYALSVSAADRTRCPRLTVKSSAT